MAAAAGIAVGLPCAAQAKKKKKSAGKRDSPGAELPVIAKKGPTYFVLNRKNYEITENTEIKIDGKEASFRQLKAGMKASVSGRVLTYGRTSSLTIYEARRVVAYSQTGGKKR